MINSENQTLTNVFLYLWGISNWLNKFYSPLNAISPETPYFSVQGSNLIAAIQIIQKQESAQLSFFISELMNLGISATSLPNPAYDYRAVTTTSPSGFYHNFSTNLLTFLNLVQILEDTTTRAYLGQVPYLLGNPTLLVQVSGLMSIHARRAAFFRNLEFQNGILQPESISANSTLSQGLKPWVSRDGTFASGLPSATDSIPSANTIPYTGEALSVQSQINIININNKSQIDLNAATESFDEPLSSLSVMAIVNSFLIL